MRIESNEASARVCAYPEFILQNYITFFTPTYNRAEYLTRVYRCLLNQTCQRFVWLIVNDGSKDSTDAVAAEILRSNSIPVMYIEKENGGKHSAFQVALNYTKTGYFACMDDDDLYDYTSVDFFLNQWERIKKDRDDNIGAIRVLSRRSNGSIVSSIQVNEDSESFWDLSTLDCFYKKHLIMENWTCYRTDALRNVDIFPKNYWLSQNHRFFAEGIWQGRFARKYMCRYVMVSLREYRDDIADSLMKSSLSPDRYMDVFINKKMILDEQFDFFWYYPFWFLRQVLIVSMLRKAVRISLSDLLSNTKNQALRTLFFITCPASLFSCFVLKK